MTSTCTAPEGYVSCSLISTESTPISISQHPGITSIHVLGLTNISCLSHFSDLLSLELLKPVAATNPRICLIGTFWSADSACLATHFCEVHTYTMTHSASVELSNADIIGLVALVLAFITSIVSIIVSIIIGIATYRLMLRSKRGMRRFYLRWISLYCSICGSWTYCFRCHRIGACDRQ